MAWAIIYTRVTSDTVGDEVKEDDKEHGNLGEVTCYHFHVTIASAKAQWKNLYLSNSFLHSIQHESNWQENKQTHNT